MSTSEQNPTAEKSSVAEAHENATWNKPPAPRSGSGRTIGLLFLVVVLVAVGYGLWQRSAHEKALKHVTEEAAILSVRVTHPTAGSAAEDLVLPGSVQAFVEAPIYSRTNGYLRKWYFDIGARVKKGQLLAEIETPEVDQQLSQSRAELERMQANAELARVTSVRWQSLLAKHAVSAQEADQTRSNYIAAQAAVDASRANVRRLEQLQSYERITAPFDGIITARNTDIGDLINSGAGSGTGTNVGSTSPRELFHLAAMEKLRIYISIPEVYSDLIINGDSAVITQDASPDMKITGRIVRNANAIDNSTRTLNVEIDVDNSKGLLKPGAYVFAHFHLPASENTVTVPSNSLLFRAEGLRVGVVKNNQVTLTPITIGHDYGSTVEVTSGLTTNDLVILDPPDSLIGGVEVHTEQQESATAEPAAGQGKK